MCYNLFFIVANSSVPSMVLSYLEEFVAWRCFCTAHCEMLWLRCVDGGHVAFLNWFMIADCPVLWLSLASLGLVEAGLVEVGQVLESPL